MDKTRRLLLILAIGMLAGCQFSTDSSSTDVLTAEPWPEADALFQSDQNWLTGDGLYSIDLGNGRVLWLFGDSFVATSARRVRSEAKIVRNSVAVQSGYDPSTASIEFHWNVANGEPQSFFPDDDGTWFWPGDGVLVDGMLLIFLMRLRAVDSDFGFESAGWEAVLVTNPDDEPSDWQWSWMSRPESTFDIQVGGAEVLRVEDYVYAFGAEAEESGNIHLVRWSVTSVLRGDLTAPQWWTGEPAGWVVQSELDSQPSTVFRDGQTEFTVHYEPLLGQFLQIQTVGFGAADIGLRTADAINGPYSKLDVFYRPEEHDEPDAFIYEGKSHPELVGADVVLTYFPSSFDFGKLVNDMSGGWPRFLRGSIRSKR